MKEAGQEPKRKRFNIEQHFDDCGSDLSGLGSEVAYLSADYVIADRSELEELHSGRPRSMSEIYSTYSEEQMQSFHRESTSLALWFLKGSGGSTTDFNTDRPALRTCSSLE